MARKVLISFLGTGPLESKDKRIYRTAHYHLGETDLGEYSFVAAALEKHYQVDATFLVGTVHSMWEEVYKWHREEDGQQVDEDIYLEIADGCEQANHQSSLNIPHQQAIEEALGGSSKVILIKYGISEQEVRDNINIILGIESLLKNGDELIVDVTHSFRSLPIFLMNLLVYLQNVSKKKIDISHIHYGMLEIRNELGFAPIIDLKAILEINDWITGAYSFSEFGNAYMISQLIKNEDKSSETLLDEFSNLMNLNHLYGIKTLAQRISCLTNKEYGSLLPNLALTPIIRAFVNQFRVDKNDKDSRFQFQVAKWQFEHRKYAQSYLTLSESLISYICEINNFEPDKFEDREYAKLILRGKANPQCKCNNQISKIFKEINKIRNSTAHAVETGISTKKMIETLSNSIEDIEKIIK